MQVKPEMKEQHAADVVQPDAYKQGIRNYGEAWGDAMEAMMVDGRTVAEVAADAGAAVDDEYTGMMRRFAAVYVAQYWVHDEEFRQWWNAGGKEA